MVPTASDPPAVFHLTTVDPKKGLDLVEVEGGLEPVAVTRWSGLLQGAINEGATGIAVDLRGCHTLDPLCLSVMVAASAMLKARGGGGVKLVTYPGSGLGRRLRTGAAEGLPSYASAAGALESFGEAW
jgi:hypothetical protein